ncbi:hypothetical protein IW261DRAFT_1424879 [Armillaria novae-zelandiae]|uniref:Uncharacterized protein n=1 Tax=Armillaria novae-zelandiae TaxID=153914 RepID=A0AA39U0R1_9AGAR|nr:hypothetical protein IW261DRAFT_1424879 [Armillaria novae-zelandiae]
MQDLSGVKVFSDMALSVSQKRQSAPVYPDEVASDSDITAANTMKWRTLLWSNEKLFAFRQMLMMKEVGKKLDIIQDVDRDIQDMEAFLQSPTPFDAITVIALLTQKMSADLDPILDHAMHEFTINWMTSDGSQAKAFHELISMN